MDRRKITDKTEYLTIFLDILKKEINKENIKYMETKGFKDKKIKLKEFLSPKEKYERILETKKLSAKRKELTSLNFIKKDKKYTINCNGILSHIMKLISQTFENKDILLFKTEDYKKEIEGIIKQSNNINIDNKILNNYLKNEIECLSDSKIPFNFSLNQLFIFLIQSIGLNQKETDEDILKDKNIPKELKEFYDFLDICVKFTKFTLNPLIPILSVKDSKVNNYLI